ncbi:ABC transporter ATP-binding protein [Clostridium botulinum]|uniref:ABC transporter, ATP-binding protein n=2 Tax=Clostridium botulinum TaxID=1491 RepID=A7GI39_CLOBL|nr:ABC transporter ATP-binding protein [Clostridium botulinum]EKX78031.1 ABC transporter ATP-binding protein [Clostridium botulinum CFSAN001628]ABS41660.1 ABC transporter, ATP-binding protein [Clostridium botulinum F str. Langeland]ACA44775.1 ABC transporter, ATP-binding protein [Clostridium botulinum B1 str. Okra]ADG00814.1 ABC transporter, ATP-binding protein [Clostridium botulinum F str. 230613]KKM40679.1 peptide ABC transporter ATP-binding protein [Clostridium botulinum]
MLSINKLYRTYGSGETKVDAIKNINLTINQGEFVAIVGASGSGKSTLLHAMAGLDKPTGGNIIIDNQDIYDLDVDSLAAFRRKKIGFVFQFFNLIPVLTLEENIQLPILLDHEKIDKDYLNELLDILDLRGRRDHLPSQLSGGQQQRAAIARALINKPSIIFADEPTGNLDKKNSKEVMELLKLSCKKYKQTLVIVTHDLEIASKADRIITISDGEVK